MYILDVAMATLYYLFDEYFVWFKGCHCDF